jgi:phytoene dehydrogenase-like protein
VPEETDVIIVGAGLAGLRAAQVLTRQGHAVRLIESSDHVGGRVRSHWCDDFLLDDGFQLINPSYPELVTSGVLAALDLRSFAPVIQFSGTATSLRIADPRYAPWASLGSLGNLLSWSDGLRFARLLGRVRFTPTAQLLRGTDCSTNDGLLAAGISPAMITRVLQPFLRGTMLDDDLETSWRYGQLLLKYFVSGRPGTPPSGVATLPQSLLDASPAVQLHLSEPVASVTATSVTTSAATYGARCVLVATDQSTTASWFGTTDNGWRSQTAYWFATPRMEKTNQFRIDTERGIWNALEISSVAPERAPAGRGLVVASGVGVIDDPHVATDVARLYDLEERDVTLIERQVVTRALPKVLPPLTTRPAQYGEVFVAGDWLSSPSIQGAMESGKRAAAAISALLAP